MSGPFSVELRRWGSIHSAVLLGAGLVITGFAMIGISWWGTARTFFLPSQVAYLLSGGVLGLATVGCGITVTGAHLHRVSAARRAATMASVTSEASAVVGALRRRTFEEVS